ncbi:MAG: amino acid permease [Bacteroidota bacterium]|nr:amino acid permease [Bacteroidota bacterium]
MNSDTQPKLRRVLGWRDAAAVLIGITIGAGIFAVPQEIARNMESFNQIIWLWIGAGAFCVISCMVYAELGTRLPNTGGEYVYINRAYGPFTGFMFGWSQLLIVRTSNVAGLSLVTVAYLEYIVELGPWQETAMAIAIVAAIGLLNYTGIQRASMYQKFSAITKVLGLLLLVLVGLSMLPGQENHLADTATSAGGRGFLGNTAESLLLVLFAMIGWERVGYVAGELKNPRRSIPKAIFVGFGIVMVVYLGINLVYHQVLGIELIRASNRVGVELAQVLFGPVGAVLIAVVVMISATGSINGTAMAAPRLYYAMARDGLFFRWLNFVHPRFRTPSRAVVLHCIWGVCLLFLRGSFENIATGMIFVVLIVYGLQTAALMIFRHRNTGDPAAWSMPGYPYLPILFLLGTIALLSVRMYFNWQQSLIDLAFVITGLPVAWFFFRGKPK